MGPKSALGTTGQSAIVYTKSHPKGLGVHKVVGVLLLFAVNLRPYPNLAILFFIDEPSRAETDSHLRPEVTY